jgi:hypothetical protein
MRSDLVAVICSVMFLVSCASTTESTTTHEAGARTDSASTPDTASQRARDTFMSATFESPQQRWTLLCDNPELSVGLRNDAATLFVRAIVWSDGDDSEGLEPSSRQPVGDHSTLMVHFGDSAVRTAGQDLNLILNPWPQLPGIRVSRYTSGTTTTALQEVPGASGSITYVPGPGGKAIRTDEYEVPLSPLGLGLGATIALAFYASSAVPAFMTSCAPGFERGNFYPTAIPVARYRRVTLQIE